jgi:hypothetical protein
MGSEETKIRPDTNFIYSFGYEYERTHTGMIRYLCNLWNNDCKFPLNSFLQYLIGDDLLKKVSKIEAKPEYCISSVPRRSADLIIFNNSNGASDPIIAIEMKTTDKIGKSQIDSYLNSNKFNEKTVILCVTVGGISDYGNRYLAKELESNKRLRHIDTTKFYGGINAALEKTPKNTLDKFGYELIKQWGNSIKEDLDTRKFPADGNTENFDAFSKKLTSTTHTFCKPSRYWDLYFLDSLLESIKLDTRFIDLQKNQPITKYPSVYPKGQVDTILNFWWPPDSYHTYIEINDNCKMNLKYENNGLKKADELRIEYKSKYKIYIPDITITERGRMGKTTALLNFDVGIIRSKNGNEKLFTFSKDKEATIQKIVNVLECHFKISEMT